MLSTHLEKEKNPLSLHSKDEFSVHMEKNCALISMLKLSTQNFSQKFS